VKTYKNLYAEICSFENLLSACQKAARGKRFKENVAGFNVNMEKELLQLQRDLQACAYRPGKYRHFTVYESKKRLISAAPFRDRVVHHALCNIIEPLFDRTFIYDSYACRKGKGTHQAVERCSAFTRKNRYVLKCDIRRYCPSVDHEILSRMFEEKIKDRRVLWLLNTIIESSDGGSQDELLYFPGDDLFTPLTRRRGLPIGNQTSQFFANVYLNEFDYFIKEQLACRYYIRYVDDFVIFDSDKQRLSMIKEQIKNQLAILRLRLHPHKCQIFPVEQGTDFLGFRIFPTHRLVRKSNVKRFKRKLRRFQKAYCCGDKDFCEINQSVQSWLGHAKWADSYTLRKTIFKNTSFTTGQVT
jgi:retron-type reverse transcriptase